MTDTRTNEEIVEAAIWHGWPDLWPASHADNVSEALTAAGRLIDQESVALIQAHYGPDANTASLIKEAIRHYCEDV